MHRTADWDELGESRIQVMDNLVHHRSILMNIEVSQPQEIKAMEEGTCGSIITRPRYGSYNFLLQAC